MKQLFFILFLFPILAKGQIKTVVAKYAIDEPSTENLNDNILGRWKFEEDTNKNNFYELVRHEPYKLDRYHIKFWDRGGTNASHESNLHLSKIGKAWFVNVPYHDERPSHSGYFFLKILDISPDFAKITATVVHDATLWNLSQEELKQRITENVNNPAYYFDTVHLYKVK